jgi:cytochrome bd-type quinol oxidase subunit 2
MNSKNKPKQPSKLEKIRQKAIWLASALEVVVLIMAVLGWIYDTDNDVCNQTNPYMLPLVLAALTSVLLVFWSIENKSASNHKKWAIFILFLIIGIVSVAGVAFNGHVLCNLTF